VNHAERPHVLIARVDSDGDVLLAGPAIRAVARDAGRVTLLCGPRGRQAAHLLPGVDEVVIRHIPWIDPDPAPTGRAGMLALVDDVAALRADRAFVLTSFHQSPLPLALLLRMAGVPEIAATSADYPGSLLDVRHRITDDVHEVERSLSLVGSLGHTLPPGDDGALEVRRDRAGRQLSQIAPAFAGVPFVAVHPGASVPARAWAPEHHRALVTSLRSRGHAVAVTGGPGEEQLTRFVAGAGGPGLVDLGGRTSLAELAEILAHAAVTVAGNTGPAHLAAAVGTPVVSIFAPTVPAVRWRPWEVEHVLLGDQDIPCAGCRARDCPIEAHPCVDVQVGVEDAVAAVEVLARDRAAPMRLRPVEAAA
jgi:ADP-heptose:LPS heptosyltransferase